VNECCTHHSKVGRINSNMSTPYLVKIDKNSEKLHFIIIIISCLILDCNSVRSWSTSTIIALHNQKWIWKIRHTFTYLFTYLLF